MEAIMSEVASSGQAKLLLDALDQRTRLLKLVRGRPSYPWYLVPVFLVAFGGIIWPEVIDKVGDLGLLLFLVVCIFGGELDKARRLDKRFDALIKVLEKDGVLQDGVHRQD
jgi:hypothetical protein